MRNKSNFTPEWKAMIEKDIAVCEETILTPQKTRSVFYEMKAKYTPVYPQICDGIPNFANVPGGVKVEELRMFKGALKVILINKIEPQISNQQAVNIYIGKFKNNGIIGTDNQMTKSNEFGLEVNMSELPKAKILKRRR